jgi:hypothetical protein
VDEGYKNRLHGYTKNLVADQNNNIDVFRCTLDEDKKYDIDN